MELNHVFLVMNLSEETYKMKMSSQTEKRTTLLEHFKKNNPWIFDPCLEDFYQFNEAYGTNVPSMALFPLQEQYINNTVSLDVFQEGRIDQETGLHDPRYLYASAVHCRDNEQKKQLMRLFNISGLICNTMHIEKPDYFSLKPQSLPSKLQWKYSEQKSSFWLRCSEDKKEYIDYVLTCLRLQFIALNLSWTCSKVKESSDFCFCIAQPTNKENFEIYKELFMVGKNIPASTNLVFRPKIESQPLTDTVIIKSDYKKNLKQEPLVIISESDNDEDCPEKLVTQKKVLLKPKG